MKKIFFMCCLFNTSLLFSQSNLIDSLVNELKNFTKEDTNRATLLNKISREYAFSDAKEGLRYADSSIALCLKIKSEVKLATAYFAKGTNLSSLGKDSVAIEFFKQSYVLNLKLEREMGCATVLQNMGISYYNISQYAKALDCYKEALRIFKKLESKKGVAATLNSLAIVYMDLSDYPKSLDYYFESLKNCEASQDSSGIAVAYSNMGIVHNKLHDSNKSLDYQLKALAINQKIGNKKQIASCYNNLANVYINMNKVEKAFEYYDRALEINQQIENKFGIASNFSNMGIDYSTLGNYSKALEYLQKSIPMYEDLGDKANLALMLNEIGTVYFKAPDAVLKKENILPSQRYSKAVELKNRALAIYNEVGDISGAADSYESLSEIYKEQNDFKNSLLAYQQFILLRDSVVNDGKKIDIAKKEMQYDFEKKQAIVKAENEKQQTIAQAQIEKEKLTRNYTFAGVGLLAIMGAAGFVSYKRRRDTLQKKKEAELNVEIADTEMKALRAQMNPHFIFNSLNSINDYIDKSEPQTASLFATKFAKLMRMILENSEKKEVRLSEDLQALELYMQLESLRLKNKFTYQIKVADEIDTENILIPPLILQPFVENSIWHGISKKKGKGKINISISKDGEMIICCVEDNGVGRKVSAQIETVDLPEKKSLGMKITKTRIDLINKIKKTNASINLTDLEQGLRVDIKLPYQTMF